MNKDLAQQAITSALHGDWEEAVKLNKKIIKNEGKDIDALNRLARAFSELGKYKKAIKTSEKVLKIDPFNSIAQKSIKKWQEAKDTKKKNITKKHLSPQSFLEESGKTKIVPLMHLGDSKIIAQLDSGDEVEIKTHSHRIGVFTEDNKYIGRLPDDLSARLRKLIKYGNRYQIFIKSINEDEVKVFIKETRRGKNLQDIPSFSSEKIDYISFTPPELVHKKNDRPETSNQDEEDE